MRSEQAVQGMGRYRRGMAGVSLVELMVALALGVVLVLGLTQVFGSIRASFSAADGMSRLQENSRFAMQFMREDLLMAGFLGCSGLGNVHGKLALFNRLATNPAGAPGALQAWESPLRIGMFEPNPAAGDPPYVAQLHRPIEIYDFVGTNPGATLATALLEFPAGVTNAANFAPALPARLTATSADLGTTGLLGGQAGDLVPGSDFFVVRYLRGHEPLLDTNGGVLPGRVNKATWQLTRTDTLANLADAFPPWTLWGLVKCGSGATLMQINAASPRAAPQDSGTLNRWAVWDGGLWAPEAQEPDFAAGDLAYRFEYALYHVGRTGNDTPPALFRRRLLANPGSSAAALTFGPAEELVPGVEMMQILLGVDTEHEGAQCLPAAAAPVAPETLTQRVRSCSNDDTVTVFRSASQHFANPPAPAGPLTAQQIFQRQLAIKSVRISLLVRSPERLPSTVAPVSNTFTVGDVVVTPPNDGRLRHVYDTTVTLRNRVRN